MPAKKQKLSKPIEISGDALDEDFLLEDGFLSDNSEEGEIILPQELASSPKPTVAADETAHAYSEGKKRKAEAVIKNSKPKKIKETSSEKDISLGLLEVEELVVQFRAKQARAMVNSSELEMDEFRIEESMIFDTAKVIERKALGDFLKEGIPGLPSTLAKPPKQPGSPRVLVIAGSALRVADLCREVKSFKTKDIDIGKLFAKHFKLAEHADYLKKTKVGIAVGTPGRIGKLFTDTDSLHLTHLSHLILDVSHLDSKNRNLLDMPEVREDVFKNVIGNKKLMERLRSGHMKLVLY